MSYAPEASMKIVGKIKEIKPEIICDFHECNNMPMIPPTIPIITRHIKDRAQKDNSLFKKL
jgi:hypothetical protein